MLFSWPTIRHLCNHFTKSHLSDEGLNAPENLTVDTYLFVIEPQIGKNYYEIIYTHKAITPVSKDLQLL